MNIENIKNMDFGRAHHSGMPTAEEVKWKIQMEVQERNAKFYPNGTINNFRKPRDFSRISAEAYAIRVEKAEYDWFYRHQDGVA